SLAARITPLPHRGRGRRARRASRVRVYRPEYPHPLSRFALRHPPPLAGEGWGGGNALGQPLTGLVYSLSLTCSPHCVPSPFSPASDSARCAKSRSGAAPFQCILLGGMLSM